jgi:uncharacterized repeat protein (TIGR01451 family)
VKVNVHRRRACSADCSQSKKEVKVSRLNRLFIWVAFMVSLTLLTLLVLTMDIAKTAHAAASLPSPNADVDKVNPQALAAATYVQGHITTTTTWTAANSPYIVSGPTHCCWLVIDPGVTLTIEPGVVVKFETTNRDLTVQGSLRALGTSAAPIVFTSYKDDAHGGDTNGDGDDSQPAPGDWRGITFAPSSTDNLLQHVWIGYAAGNGAYEAVLAQTEGDALALDHVTIAHSAYHGLQITGDWPQVDDCEFRQNAVAGINSHNAAPLVDTPVHLRNTRFISNTGWAVAFDTFSEALGTDIDADSNEALGNGGNGWYLGGGKHITGSVTLTATGDFPFVFGPNSVIDRDATLTLAPGTTIKFEGNAGLSVEGQLQAIGTETAPINFTSLNDDVHGGDTNNDGATTTPAAGQWKCLVFPSEGQGSALEHAWIAYGGDGCWAPVSIHDDDVTIRHSEMAHSNANAVLYVENSSPVIEWNSIHHGTYGGVWVRQMDAAHPTSPTFTGNVVQDNARGFDVEGTRTVVLRDNAIFNSHWEGLRYQRTSWDTCGQTPCATRLDARHNWWGDSGGPYEIHRNPHGTGDTIGDYPVHYTIDFIPWLDRPAPGTVPIDTLTLGLSSAPHVSPGGDHVYRIYVANYRDLTDPAVRDTVVALLLPRTLEFVSGSTGAIYWPENHTVFWKMGLFPYGGKAELTVRTRATWGLTADSQMTAMLRVGGSNLPNSAFDVTPYLDYATTAYVSAETLTRAAFDVDRGLLPDLNTLFQDAEAAGYAYAGYYRRTLSDTTQLKEAILVSPQRTGYVRLILRDGKVYSHELVRDSHYVVKDVTGGVRYDGATAETTFFGDWDAQRAALTTCGTGTCLRNCAMEALGSCAISLMSGGAGKVLDAIACLSDPLSAGCAGAILGAPPPLGCAIGFGQCGLDCADPSTHCCTEDKIVPASLFGLFGVNACKRTRCNTTTGTWYFLSEYTYCKGREICIPGYGCGYCPDNTRLSPAALCDADNSYCDDTGVTPAKDPNAKYGPAGALLAGQTVSYTITYENEGSGTAYGVFIVDPLSEHFDLTSVQIGGPGFLVTDTATLYWDIGELLPKGQPGSTGSVTFTARLDASLPLGTEIVNAATVYFPSVPEETPTNVVINTIANLAAIPQALTAEAGQPVTVSLAGRGGTDYTYEIVSGPLYGALSGTAPSLTYTSAPGFTGVDRLSYRVSSGGQTSDATDITILVAPWVGDTTPPTVIRTVPADGAYIGAPSTSTILTDTTGSVYPPLVTIQFSEAVSTTGITSDTVQLMAAGGTDIPISVQPSGADQVTLWLRSPLAAETTYTVSVAEVADLMGNAMATVHSWTFMTSDPDPSPGWSIYLPVVIR